MLVGIAVIIAGTVAAVFVNDHTSLGGSEFEE